MGDLVGPADKYPVTEGAEVGRADGFAVGLGVVGVTVGLDVPTVGEKVGPAVSKAVGAAVRMIEGCAD